MRMLYIGEKGMTFTGPGCAWIPNANALYCFSMFIQEGALAPRFLKLILCLALLCLYKPATVAPRFPKQLFCASFPEAKCNYATRFPKHEKILQKCTNANRFPKHIKFLQGFD